MTGTDIPACGPLADSAARFLGSAQALTDADLTEPSALPGWIRAHVLTHVTQAAIREHPSQLWDAPGIWLGGNRRPVRGVVPGLRRELEYHHLDLAAGYQPSDWPDDFVAIELARVTDMMDRRADVPPMTLTGSGVLHIRSGPPVDVTGPPPAMLAWLSGRGDGTGLDTDTTALPRIPPLS